MRGETETGDPVFVTCNQALKRIDHILHTMHVAVDLAILDQIRTGSPRRPMQSSSTNSRTSYPALSVDSLSTSGERRGRATE